MTISQTALRELRTSVGGAVLSPATEGYETARRIYNAMIDRRPAAIVRCAGGPDVAACVAWARAHGVEVSVKGGGHNVSGKAVCEGGLMIDLSAMKDIRVDPRRRVARAAAGLTLAEFDRACQAEGLATPMGIVSPTGIAGLTLGGGIGWLGGTHGLACDNVAAADVVTADGRVLTASSTEHPDLFWAIRGGGANVGVVTAFDYRLHPVGPVLGGGVAWPAGRATSVLAFYGEFARACPDELSVNALLAAGPDGSPVVAVGVAWAGDLDAGERTLKPLRAFDHPAADDVAPMSYVQLQSGGDGAFPHGRRHYWKAGFLRRLGPEVIDVLVHFAATRPSPHTILGLQQMHGAAARVPPAETAFAHRHDQWDCLVLTQWDSPADDEENIRWTRECHAALTPHLEPSVYVNDLGADEAGRVRAAYGGNYEQLVAVKAAYDPGNFFRGNQNVATA
jgi:FAD/FMN-containing dehydrogenase